MSNNVADTIILIIINTLLLNNNTPSALRKLSTQASALPTVSLVLLLFHFEKVVRYIEELSLNSPPI